MASLKSTTANVFFVYFQEKQKAASVNIFIRNLDSFFIELNMYVH